MAKFCKKSLFIVVLAICLAACFALAACNNDDPPEANTAKYTVTVNTGADAPAEGVKVTIKKGTATFEFKTTDATGKTVFELAEDEYDVVLSNLPANYSVADADALKLTKENKDLTVTLVKAFSYTVNLVNAKDGTPFYSEGVQVGVCTLAGNCLEPVSLGENGTAEIYVAKNNYHVQILDLPAGFTYERDENGYYTGKNFSATDTEMTIKIYEITSVLDAEAMTDAEKTEYTAANGFYPASAHKFPSYAFTKTLEANETAHFSITPAISGAYSFYCGESNLKLKFLSNSTSFVPLGGQAIFNEITLEAGKTFYINVENSTAEQLTAKFVIASPVSSYVEKEGVGATVNLTVSQQNVNAVVAFKPTKAGKYTASVKGEALAYVSLGKTTFIDTPVDSALYVKNASYSTKVTPDALGSTIYFAVSVKAESYPANIDLQIVLDKEITNTTNVVSANGEIAKYTFADSSKELTPVEMSSATTLVKGSDGYYHLGTADGPVVVVMLTEQLDSFRFGEAAALAYFEMSDIPAKYVFDVTSAQDKENLEKGNTFNDYRLLIRGFNEYDQEPGMFGMVNVIPETLENENCYAANVNADGVYPLNQDLYDFLLAFGNANHDIIYWQVDMSTEAGCEWMFPLYYYGEKEEAADVIVGNYNVRFLNEYGDEYNVGDDYYGEILKETDFTLTVTNTAYAIRKYDSMQETYEELERGTWTKNDNGTYTFGFTDFMGTVEYSVVFNAESSTVTFTNDANETVYVFVKA